jgi:hypothetical protein
MAMVRGGAAVALLALAACSSSSGGKPLVTTQVAPNLPEQETTQYPGEPGPPLGGPPLVPISGPVPADAAAEGDTGAPQDADAD